MRSMARAGAPAKSLRETDSPSRSVVRLLSGRAHRDAEPNAKKAATRYGQRGTRTQYDHQRDGSPEIRAAQEFIRKSAFPARHGATVMAEAQRSELRGMSETEVIALYHEALRHEKQAEASDTCSDLSCAECWALDGAVNAERDLAWDARKSACLRWFAEHGVPRARVYG